MKPKQPNRDSSRHPIKVVASRTGLSPEVLRVWEKRYGVVAPGRTQGGQRLYSDEEIERLRLLRALTLEGRRIGEVSALSTEQLRALLIEDQDARPRTETEVLPSADATNLMVQALRAVEDLDQQGLRSTLARAQINLGVTEFVEGVVAPLARDLGARWARADLQIHQEHFATVEIRRVLTRIMEAVTMDETKPRLVVSTTSGEHHELGALLAAAVAAGEGWRLTYLGPNLPAEDIAQAVGSLDATAVALSVVYPQNLPVAEEELRQLRAQLPRKVSIIVGGPAFGPHPAIVREIGAEWVPDLRHFPALLERLAGASR
jgi:DNA-binding transcriptional MerR regulator